MGPPRVGEGVTTLERPPAQLDADMRGSILIANNPGDLNGVVTDYMARHPGVTRDDAVSRYGGTLEWMRQHRQITGRLGERLDFAATIMGDRSAYLARARAQITSGTGITLPPRINPNAPPIRISSGGQTYTAYVGAAPSGTGYVPLRPYGDQPVYVAAADAPRLSAASDLSYAPVDANRASGELNIMVRNGIAQGIDSAHMQRAEIGGTMPRVEYDVVDGQIRNVRVDISSVRLKGNPLTPDQARDLTAAITRNLEGQPVLPGAMGASGHYVYS